MIYQERGHDDPKCRSQDDVGPYKLETDRNGDLLRVALWRGMSSSD